MDESISLTWPCPLPSTPDALVTVIMTNGAFLSRKQRRPRRQWRYAQERSRPDIPKPTVDMDKTRMDSLLV